MGKSTTMPARDLKQVLIIEDEGEMSLLLNIVLDSKEINLEHVQSIEKAKEYLKRLVPSVILLDNKLPDGFGVDFVSYIKTNYPDIRIIMISGYGISAKEIALQNGVDQFIEKPFTKEEVSMALDRYLN